MFLSNRAIPRATTAALVLGGCSSEPTFEELAASWCASYERCAPTDFGYDSVEECAALSAAEAANAFDQFEMNYGEACSDAYFDYYECFVDAYASTCDEYAIVEACAAALEHVYAVCELPTEP